MPITLNRCTVGWEVPTADNSFGEQMGCPNAVVHVGQDTKAPPSSLLCRPPNVHQAAGYYVAGESQKRPKCIDMEDNISYFIF